MPDQKPVESSWTIESKAAYDAEKGKNSKGSKQVTAVLFLIVGLLILGFSAVEHTPYLLGAEARYQSTVGTITATDYGRRGKCTVDLDFTVDGKEYKTSQRAARASCDDTVGKRMTLRYDPKDIQGTVTDSTQDGSRFMAWGSLSLGATIIGIGFLLWRRASRMKDDPKPVGTTTTASSEAKS
jgi:hypothetical protein